MTTTKSEAQLRLDTLTRNLDQPTSGGEVTRGVAVAVGLLALIALQVFLFAPVLSSFAGK